MRWTNFLARLRRPLTVLASVAVTTGVMLPTGAPASSPPTVQRVVATPIPMPEFKPLKLTIPKIGVEHDVEPVGPEPDGTMASPSNGQNIGWWAGRKAGEGNVLLDGHHDWNGATGPFYRLQELKKGDEVVVAGDGKNEKLVYKVIWVKNYDRNIDATDLLGNKSGSQVATLITCGGT